MAVPGLFFAFEIIAVFVLALYLVHKYGNWRKDHWATTLSVVTTWFLCFAAVFVLPSDISATFYHRCKGVNATSENTGARNESLCHRPWSFVTEETQRNFWALSYWSLQLLSWLILPFIQSYVMAAQFTIRGKLLQMLKENAIWYGSFLVIFGVLFIYIIAKGSLSGTSLKILITTAANTWGLLILVLLLGYGLVDMPRSFWNKGRLNYQLQKAYYSVSKLRNDMEEAKEKLDDVFKDVKFVSEKIRYNNPNRHCVDTILAKCPDDLARQGSRGVDDFEDFSDGQKSDLTSMSGLVALHGRVIKSSRNSKRTEVQYKESVAMAIAYEELEENRHSRTQVFLSTYGRSRLHKFSPRLEWWWKIRIRPILWILLSVLFTLMSVMILWSEVTFFQLKPVLSIPAILFKLASHSAKDTDASDSKNDYAFIELFSLFCISYIASCAYYPIYKIRLFNFYYLASNHQTDQGSLLFNAMFISRVVAPLCLNFLGLIHMDSHIAEDNTAEELQTSFTQTMGHLDVIPFISKGFYLYFPIILCVLSLLTLFRLGTHIAACCGFSAFILDDEVTSEYVKQGKNYTRLERRTRDRQDKRGADAEARAAKELSSLRHSEPVAIASDNGLEAGRAVNSDRGSRQDRSSKRFNMRYSRLSGKDDKVALTSAEQLPDVVTRTSSSERSNILDPAPKNPVLPKHHATAASTSKPSPSRTRHQAPPKNLFDDI